jgi:hypothetical protein
VFQLLRREQSRDHMTAYERGAYVDRPDCWRMAHSCYRAIEPLQWKLRAQPWKWRGIARADLEPQHGAIKHTPSAPEPGHHSLWLRAQYRARDLFIEIPKGDIS